MISFLLDAIATDLQTHLSLTDSNCDVMPDLQPKPISGNQFVGIVGAEGGNTAPTLSGTNGPVLQIGYGVICSLSVRSTTTVHRQRRRYIDDSTSIMELAVRVAKRLHGNYANIMANAKTLLDASDVGGLYTGRLQMTSMQMTPTLVDAAWFYSDDDDNRKDQMSNSHGLHMTVNFSGVRWTNE